MSDSKLTALVFRLLQWFCPDHLYEEIEGDLIQEFNRDVMRFGNRNANRRLIWNVVRFFRPGIILRNSFSVELNKLDMVASYLKIAYRRLMGSKSISLINVFGLTLGITAFLLVIQYVTFEWTFDSIHQNKDQVYRIAYEQYENGELKNNSARNFVGIQSLLNEHFPEVRACTGFDRTSSTAGFLFAYHGKTFYETEPFYQTDSSFFNVFPSLLLKGDPSYVLREPHHLVISEKMAKLIFGNDDPMGRHIENKSPSYADASDFVITGVMRDAPENSHFHINFIALIHKDEVTTPNYWSGPKLYSYLTVAEKTDATQISAKLNALLKKLEPENPKTKGTQVFLQPISDIHLQSKLEDELEPNGNEFLLFIVLAIGITIIALAWINYVNIETARFTSRLKEVGIRRVIGSSKRDLALQFLIEYSCMTILAGSLAIVLFKFILPHFAYLTGIPIHGSQFSPEIWSGAIVLFCFGTIVAGVYPAIFLVKINPVVTLKGKFSGTIRGVLVRKSLLLFQFTSSMALVAFLLIINEQLDHMRLTNKKIDLDQVVSVRNPFVYANDDDSINYAEFTALKNRLLQGSLVKNVTSSSVIPGAEIDEYFTNRLKRNPDDPYDPTRFKLLFVDYDFIPFYDLKLKAGRNYSLEMGDEENWHTIILNEKAIKMLGFKSATEAINQEINFHLWGPDFKKYKIVGIVEDYHQEAVKKEIEPTVLSLNHSRFQQVFYSIKLSNECSPQEGLAFIEKSWKEVFPDKPFEYFFQDGYYDRQFKSELHATRVFTLFAAIAVFIACLGILGMTLFESNARLREISIRKVLGASIASLMALLSTKYIRLLILSTLISIPVIYFPAKEWLSTYPLRIQLSPDFFLVPLGVIFITVIITSFFQTLKAALANPVNHLKNE